MEFSKAGALNLNCDVYNLLTAARPRAAVLPAVGIGDALLMLIAAHHLHGAGYHVTLFHPYIHELASWFPSCTFIHRGGRNVHEPSPSDLLDQLHPFDLIIAENDNSPTIKHLQSVYRTRLSIFYPTYLMQKHGPTSPLDQVFNPHLSMAENIGRATLKLLNLDPLTQDVRCNGITPSGALCHRRYLRRIIIHPTSREIQKNWLPSQFIQLALSLRKRGFDPHFCVAPIEKPQWEILTASFPLPLLPNLSDLATYIYESGALIGNDSLSGHLASNLSIPTLTIANDAERMRLWRPGFQEGILALPPQWLPNPRLFRWKEKYWQYFLSVRKVLKLFDKKILPSLD